jgi:hypothetical protein
MPRDPYRESSLSILDAYGTEALWAARFLFGFVKSPNFQDWVIGEIFGDGDEKGRVWHLFEMRNCCFSRIRCSKRADDFECAGEDTDNSIGITQEKAFTSSGERG